MYIQKQTHTHIRMLSLTAKGSTKDHWSNDLTTSGYRSTNGNKLHGDPAPVLI